MSEKNIYEAWNNLLEDMKAYASTHEHAVFEKEADFPDYIYRMQKEYQLPTHIMSASISDTKGNPILMLSVSPRHSVLKSVTLHPYETHVYRKLKYSAKKDAFVEKGRPFSKDMLFKLADDLFHYTSH